MSARIGADGGTNNAPGRDLHAHGASPSKVPAKFDNVNMFVNNRGFDKPNRLSGARRLTGRSRSEHQKIPFPSVVVVEIPLERPGFSGDAGI